MEEACIVKWGVMKMNKGMARERESVRVNLRDNGHAFSESYTTRLAVAVKSAASIQNCEHKAHKIGIEHGSWRTPGVM
jgi:hypothetical protein